MSVFNGRASDIEDNRNKVSTIDKNSTDEQYPSAKAVYNAVQSVKTKSDVFANALKGSASGQGYAVAKDVSPLEHTVGVKLSAEGVEDFSGVAVTVGGKNLLNLEGRNYVNFGNDSATTQRTFPGGKGIIVRFARSNAYISRPDDEYIVTDNYVEYTIISNYYGIGFDIKLKPNTKYAFGKVEGNGSVYLTEYDREGNYIKNTSLASGVITTQPTTDWGVIGFIGEKGTTVSALNPQFEYGEISTEYEPYVEPVTYTANADGSVDGVKSVYPSTSVSVEDASTAVNIEYNRDINKAFAELQAAVISLGGNV